MHFVVTLLLILISNSSSAHAYYISKGQCTPSQQREAWSDANSCEPRPTLINLRDHLSGMNDVIQVIPEYKTVSRCGGSCELISHGCIATATRSKSMDVMVVRKRHDRSQNEIECGVIVVDEDISCSCGCPVQESDCSIEQYYDRSSCQCLCKDQSSKKECISLGMEWDPLTCTCICPESLWKICSTGYFYDYFTCKCVLYSDDVWLNGDWDWYYN